MKTKNVVLWCVIAFLLVLPFITRCFRGNSFKMPENDDYAQAERFVTLHEGRVNERVESLKRQSLDESFAGLLDDQQYFSPGYHPEVMGAPKDLESLLSSRGFLKVFQQFRELPQKQAVEKLNEFCKRAIKEFGVLLEELCYSEELPPSPLPPSTSLMGAKYMVCTTMFLAAHIGEHKLLVNQINEMQNHIDTCVNRFNGSNDIPPFLLQILPSMVSLDDDCILSILIHASQRAGIDLKADSSLITLNRKTIPLFRWDAEATYYDLLPRLGYQKIDSQNAVEQFDVYEFPRDGSFNEQDRKVIINTLEESLSK